MPAERELRFTAEQLARFAAASGDRNPLHLDPEFAAGTAFGSPIVHGSLIALAMLGAIPPQQLELARSLRLSFSGAMPLGTEASIRAEQIEREAGAWEVRLSARGKTLARLLARPVTVSLRAPEAPAAPARPMRTVPAEPSLEELGAGRSLHGDYAAGPELEQLARELGAERLDRRLLEGLAWASYVVGMELPGLRSLFAGATLSLAEEPAREDRGHRLAIRDRDERTGQLTIDGELHAPAHGGTVMAAVQCFALPATASPDPSVLGIDRPAERERGAVVVAGGSRGFGASLTLALLGLGYEVHVAYASSPARARELARLAGPCEQRLHLTQLDVGDPQATQSLADAVAGTGRPLVGMVLNAALPPLAMSLTASSAGALADYVASSLRLVAVPLGALLPTLEQDGWVLLCSSAAVTAPPRDWPHYVAAKGAIEGLAGWVAQSRPALRTVVVRPPKMQTAMTGTPSGRVGAASADAIALWTAERLAGETLEPGLNMLEPTAREVAAA